MVGRFTAALVLTAALSGAAEAQQSVTVSAVILERAEAGAVNVEIRSVGSLLSVEEASPSAKGTRLLRTTFVEAGGTNGVEKTVPMRVMEGGMLRLERRGVRLESGAATELRTGERILIDGARELTVTRVVAANS